MEKQTNIYLLPQFIEYKILRGEGAEPLTAKMYEYLLAANGVFVRAQRREFSACLPLAEAKIKGLAAAEKEIVWKIPPIAAELWQQILLHARETTEPDDFRENFYAVFWRNERWHWSELSRERRFGATLADDERDEYGAACIELHTHPPGALNFSQADDRDETGKFRLFAILSDIHAAPKIRFRCGIYNHFFQIPASFVGAMPPEIVDLNGLTGKLLFLR